MSISIGTPTGNQCPCLCIGHDFDIDLGCRRRQYMSSELHIDMLFMRWRESGIYGNMVLRGTAGVVLGTSRPLSAAHNISGNTYCLNMVRPGVNQTQQTAVVDSNHTIKHAKSLRVDTRQHPSISVFYNAGLSNTTNSTLHTLASLQFCKL